MSEFALIALDNQKLKASFTQEANALKEAALDKAALVGRVSNAQENQIAVDAQRDLADLRKTVEKARKQAKEPVLEFGKQIDDQAASFIADVISEENRVSKLVGDYFQLQEAKRKAAEEAARLEAERIERDRRNEELRILREQAEREQAERRAAEALASKQRQAEAEAQRKINEAASAEARKRAEREAKIQREQAERDAIELKRQQDLAAAQTHDDLAAAQKRASDAQAAVASAVVTSPAKVTGQAVKKDVEITVTDIWLLARSHPTCVRIEPMMSEIKTLVNAGVKVAGVTTKEIFKAQTTSARVQPAIEV